MKTAFLSFAALVALLATTPSVAGIGQNDERRPAQARPDERPAPRTDKDFNYGYAKGRKVTPQEKAKWEKEHGNDQPAAHPDKDANYGYDKKHQVTAQEKAKWEREHQNDRQDTRDDRPAKDANYGYAKDHKVTAQEKAKWEREHGENRR